MAKVHSKSDTLLLDLSLIALATRLKGPLDRGPFRYPFPYSKSHPLDIAMNPGNL
jgi:hypothetical protein